MMGYPLRDADIRHHLHDRLTALHAADPCARIIHELSIPRPAARADVVVLNGAICAFEIKSDVDSLYRLPKQIRSFAEVFDKVDVVSTIKHAGTIIKKLPDWWGLQVVSSNDSRLEMVSVRTAATNPNPNNEALLHVLRLSEIIEVCSRCSIIGIHHRIRKDERIKIVLASSDAYSIRQAATEALKSRVR